MVDLHSHSIYSDGTNTPLALLEMAEERGLTALSLTDHDTVDGVAELMAAAEQSSVEAIPGIELSADCDRGTMHILGYFIDYTSAELLEKVEKVRRGREERNLEILKKLNRLGYVLQWSDVKKHAQKDVVGRPHFAQALVELGLVKSKKAVFDLLLAKGRPAYVERYRYSAKECIDLIRKAGGISVLAHPATLGRSNKELKEVFVELKGYGLGGIEVYYAEHQAENRRKFMEWAEGLGLLCTGGTDFHGENTPDLKIGVGFGQLQVPDETVSDLKSALGR